MQRDDKMRVKYLRLDLGDRGLFVLRELAQDWKEGMARRRCEGYFAAKSGWGKHHKGKFKAVLAKLVKAKLVTRHEDSRRGLAATLEITAEGLAYLANYARVMLGLDPQDVGQKTHVPAPSRARPADAAVVQAREAAAPLLRLRIEQLSPAIQSVFLAAPREGRDLLRRVFETGASVTEAELLDAGIASGDAPKWLRTIDGERALAVQRDRPASGVAHVADVLGSLLVPRAAAPGRAGEGSGGTKVPLASRVDIERVRATGVDVPAPVVSAPIVVPERNVHLGPEELQRTVDAVVAEAALRAPRVLREPSIIAEIVWDVVAGRGADQGVMERRIRGALRLINDGIWRTPRGMPDSWRIGFGHSVHLAH